MKRTTAKMNLEKKINGEMEVEFRDVPQISEQTGISKDYANVFVSHITRLSAPKKYGDFSKFIEYCKENPFKIYTEYFKDKEAELSKSLGKQIKFRNLITPENEWRITYLDSVVNELNANVAIGNPEDSATKEKICNLLKITSELIYGEIQERWCV